MNRNVGHVYLVGAGPGDEALITEKGKQCLRAADVILYDRLMNPRLLEHAGGACEFVYCGKLPHRHMMRQERINELLVQYAQEGKTVVRLKGGDPSVFGRVGEEAADLAAAGIPYEIVPGVTSSIAAAAYAGIPVTHRDYSNTFTLATGHRKEEGELDFAALAKSETIAFYMGIQNIAGICGELIRHGKDANTPVAVIEWGTTGRQKTVAATLGTIEQSMLEAHIANPAMTMIGHVVTLREQLAWFEKQPFYGKSMLIAQASAERSELAGYFAARGAHVWTVPHFRKESIALSHKQLADALEAERVIFYSPESIAPFVEAVYEAGFDIRDMPRRIEALSNKTIRELAKFGIRGSLASHSECRTVYIGKELNENDVASYGPGTVCNTHRIWPDERFHPITERLWTDFSWETVVFPNRASVASFIEEMERLGVERSVYTSLSYACIGQTVDDVARNHGFTRKDERIQEVLSHRIWKAK